MEEIKEKKKKLSSEAVGLINEQARIILQDLLKREKEIIQDNLIEQVAQIVMNENQKFSEYKQRKKINETEELLKMYIPIKIELKNIEETYLTDEEMQNQEDIFFKKIMNSQFSEIDVPIEGKIKKYKELRKTIVFIDKSIESYISYLENKNEEYKNIIKNNPSKTYEQMITKNERKIYILTNHYQKGVPVKDIKDAIYENGRKYRIDCEEMLKEIAPYFTGMYSIIIDN